MTLRSGLAVLVVLSALVPGCGSSDDAGGTGQPGGPPGAPLLKTVEPMLGVIHVAWEMPSPCDTVSAERKTSTTDYKGESWNVPGTKTSYMDEAANQNETYTYRLMCMKGDMMSDYSNEMSANPTMQ